MKVAAGANGCESAGEDAVDSRPDCVAALREALSGDLDFHGADGKNPAHAWHPFPAKFPPQLPRRFIERLTQVGDVVLDPMLGSGTTLLEADRLGRRSIGCDIDPLARLIAEAKLTPISAITALQIGNAVVGSARRMFFEGSESLAADLERRFDARTRTFVDYWFRREQQLQLTALLTSIDTEAPPTLRRFFEMALSSTIIAKSGGVSLARDLAHTRPHRDLEKKPRSAIEEFAKRLKTILSSSEEQHGRSPRTVIRATSADDTGLPSASVDLIVTSPPYANNAIDYMRAHKFSLVWLGWPLDDLRDLRSRYLGQDARGAADYARLPMQCEDTVAKLASLDPKKASALRRYFGEMSAVIGEMRRVLRAGKAAVIVVGTSLLRGIDVQTHEGLAAVGEVGGFERVGIGVRRLDRDRRMMPARWGGERTSQIERRMHEEYVIGLVKR